jgi:hypothetical protein
MTTEKQIQANRINALKGGVKTEAGKQKVRLNAVTHGFFSNDILFPGEDRQYLIDLRERLTAEVQPVGEIETLLLETFILGYWRIKRLVDYEKRNVRLSNDYRYSLPEKIMRYINTLQRQNYRAVHELEKRQKARLKASCPPPDIASIVAAISNPDNRPED